MPHTLLQRMYKNTLIERGMAVKEYWCSRPFHIFMANSWIIPAQMDHAVTSASDVTLTICVCKPSHHCKEEQRRMELDSDQKVKHPGVVWWFC